MKKGYKVEIEKETIDNTNFRKVLYTSEHSQLVLMSLKVGEEIGEEIHAENDQFFRFESGEGMVFINDTQYNVKDGDAIIVPAGSKHNIQNTSDSEALTMYTLYSPPHHKDGITHTTKIEAEESEDKMQDEFDGTYTE